MQRGQIFTGTRTFHDYIILVGKRSEKTQVIYFKMARTLTPHPHSDSTYIMRPTPVHTRQGPLPTVLIKTDSDHPPFCSGTLAQLIPAG